MEKIKNNEIICMNYLGKLYRKSFQYEQELVGEIQEGSTPYYGDEFLIDMNRILKELPEVLREIIKNDFLVINNVNWWQNKYDKHTYEELKNIAVKAFFHCLYV